MPKFECFAFFCEDFRTEIGGKTSYMGVMGPTITLDPRPADAPKDAVAVLAKVVAVALIRTDQRGEIPLRAEISFENGPENVVKHLQSDHVLNVEGQYDENLAQFHAQMPNFPAHPGMKVVASFTAGDQKFSATLRVDQGKPPESSN